MKVREALTPQTMQSALQRVIPFPCRNQYTVVILMPKASCWASVKSMLSWSSDGVSSRDAKVRFDILIYFQRLTLFLSLVNKSAFRFLSVRPVSLQILAGMAGALVLAVSLWRYSRSALKSQCLIRLTVFQTSSRIQNGSTVRLGIDTRTFQLGLCLYLSTSTWCLEIFGNKKRYTQDHIVS